jgi:GTP-binding protein Era
MDKGIDKDFACGYVTIAGKPNVGKSTLLNQLLNFPLSIVTARPQTTRHRLLGILSEADCQVIFSDSPGIMEPRYALQKLMLESVWAAIEEADLVLLMIEAHKPEIDETTRVLERLKALKKKTVLAINKVDLIAKSDLLSVIDHYNHLFAFDGIVPISALKNDGLDVLKRVLVKALPKQPPFYPPGDLTDRPQRFFVGEIVRQKVFELFGEEIPYSVAVVVDEYTERTGGKDFIRAVVICERDSQKGILIGKRGEAIRRLGQAARGAIEAFLGKEVYLELRVDVRKNWRKDERTIRRLGQI